MSASHLPDPTVYLTTHDTTTNKSTLLPPRTLHWGTADSSRLPMAVAYTAQSRPDLNQDADLLHDAHTNTPTLGLVSHHGNVLRYVDLAPGYECMMHRTQSLDYGIALAGTPECVMDGGEVQGMKVGDVMVQRGTMHAWRNPSRTEWARIVFVLMDCEPLVVGGRALREDLGWGKEFVPASDN